VGGLVHWLKWEIVKLSELSLSLSLSHQETCRSKVSIFNVHVGHFAGMYVCWRNPCKERVIVLGALISVGFAIGKRLVLAACNLFLTHTDSVCFLAYDSSFQDCLKLYHHMAQMCFKLWQCLCEVFWVWGFEPHDAARENSSLEIPWESGSPLQLLLADECRCCFGSLRN
jgi:hypothetical protein